VLISTSIHIYRKVEKAVLQFKLAYIHSCINALKVKMLKPSLLA